MPNAPCTDDRAIVQHIATLLVNGFRGRVRMCRTETLEVLLTRSADSEVNEWTPLRIKLTTKFLGRDARAAICIFKWFDKQVHARAVSAFAIKALIA